jgi:fatty acid desaturase
MIEWHERRFEGYLFETPPGVVTADVRKKDQRRNRKYRLLSFAGIALAVVVAAGAIVAIFLEHLLLVRIATLILMIVIFHELLWILKWRAEEYKKPYWLPAKSSLVEECARTRKKIRQTRWQVLWCAIAGIGGLVYLLLGFVFGVGTGEDVLEFLMAFAVPFLLIHFTELLDMRKDLPRTLEKIERDIKQLDGDPEA